MKFTPQDFEETPEVMSVESEPEEKPKKEKKPKKERPKKEKRSRSRKEPDPVTEEPTEEQPVSDETVPIDLEDDSGFEEVTDGREEKGKLSGKAIAGIILALIIGFCLFTVGLRGFISSLSLADTSAYTPAKSYDASYQAALDASVEDFDTVNQQRLEAKAAEAGSSEEGTGETPDEKEIVPNEPEEYAKEGITAEDLENTTSKDDQIQILQDEVNRLQQEAEDAKNDAALKEQELSQAQSLLEASEAREAQLRSELDALSGGTK